MKNLSILSLAMVFVLAGAVVVLGQEAAPAGDAAPAAAENESPADALGLKGLIKGLIVGVIVGFAVAFLGFTKGKDPNRKWNFQQAAPTLIWGAIVGALMGLGQGDITTLEGFKDNAATVIIAELVGKAGFRTGAPVIGNVVSTLLGKKTGGSS